MKCINTVDAAGHVLCHDITRIVKDVVKDAVFRKGHVIARSEERRVGERVSSPV